MSNKYKYSALHGKLEAFKEIITQINFDIITLINVSAEIENKLRKKNLCADELSLLDERLNKLIKKYKNQPGGKKADFETSAESDSNNSA